MKIGDKARIIRALNPENINKVVELMAFEGYRHGQCDVWCCKFDEAAPYKNPLDGSVGVSQYVGVPQHLMKLVES